MKIRNYTLISCLVFLTACGGGGSGSSDNNSVPVESNFTESTQIRTGLYRPTSSITDLSGNTVANAQLDYISITDSGEPLNLNNASLFLPDINFSFSVDGDVGRVLLDRTINHNAQTASKSVLTEIETSISTAEEGFTNISAFVEQATQFETQEDGSEKIVRIELLNGLTVTSNTFAGQILSEAELTFTPVTPFDDPLAIPNLNELVGQILTANISAMDVTGASRLMDISGAISSQEITLQIPPVVNTYAIRDYSEVMAVNNVVYRDVVTVDAIIQFSNFQTGQIFEQQQVLFLAKGIGVIRQESFATINGIGVVDAELASFNFE